MSNMVIQLTRFGLTGSLNTLIDYGIFNVLLVITGINSGWQLGLVNIIAVGVAAVNSYAINRRWTFSSGNHVGRELGRFVAATGMGMALSSLLVVSVSGMTANLPLPLLVSLNLAKLIGALFSAGWNFILYRHWVYRADRLAPAATEIEQQFKKDMLSIIIPAYNEAFRLPRRLQQMAAALGGSYPLEILVVDDGSVDQTAEIARNIASYYPFIRVISHSSNQGKGAAVRTGMLAAHGEYLVFVDADESFLPAHIEQMLQRLKLGSQMVIGRRSCQQRERVAGETRLRNLMGRSFNLLVQMLLLPGINDSQCGIKGFNCKLARQIFSRQRLSGFAFDVELLTLARALDTDITEMPVLAQDCDGSTVHPVFAPLQMAWDLVRIKTSMMFNLYNLNKPRSWQPLAAGLGMFFAALALRLPWLWEVPRYIDELKEVNLAYTIYTGQAWPLHNAAHDIGAMHNYILAAIFKLLGPSIYWPRLYVALTGALTVVLVYRLGLLIFDRWTALLAAGLLLTSGMHIVVNHMAWANCTTPFFFVMAVIATEKARVERNGRWLLGAGLLWAATLQTHSSAIVYVLVAAIYVLTPRYRSESGLGPRWYWGAAVLFFAAYANMIYYNLSSRGGSFRWLSNKSYALEQQPGLTSFVKNLEQMIIELLRSISSTYAEHNHIWQYIGHPVFVLATLLLLLGLWLAWRKKQRILIWMLLGGLLTIPWINQRYVFYVATRYIMPLNICALMLAALAVVYLLRQVGRIKHRQMVIAPAILALCLFIVMQIFPIYNYFRQNDHTNLSNRMALQIVSAICDSESKGALVLLEEDLPLENAPLPYLLNVSQIPYRTFECQLADGRPAFIDWNGLLENCGDKRMLMVMNQDTYKNNQSQMAKLHKRIFKTGIAFPKVTGQQRVIYLVEIGSPIPKISSDQGIPEDGGYAVTSR